MSTHELKVGDKVYQVSKLDRELKTQWQRRLFGRAKDTAREMKDLLDRKDYADLLKDLANDYTTGLYDFDGQKSLDFMQSQSGALALACLLFGVPEEEMIGIMLKAETEVASIIETVLHESYPDEVWQKAEVMTPALRVEAKKD
jgi:hypothetical protein